MIAAKFTPGPWSVQNATDVFGALGGDSGDGCAADANDGWHVADCSGGITFCEGLQTELGLSVKQANARLIAAAPELLATQTMGAELNTPCFLDWMADRLVDVYGESPNVDFVQSLRARATAGRAAIANATGATP